MIRLIAVIDEKHGMANEQGIPWQGKLPTDIQYFRDHTSHGTVLMGYRTYQELPKPLSDRRNLVLTTHLEVLRPGFEGVHDLAEALKISNDLWVIGGAQIFAQTILIADELYITEISGDWHCTKFFPDFSRDYMLAEQGEPQQENGITFRFNVYRRK